mgnify:CR=1 FL=1
MKAYKGFDKDLKCRGYQYEIGKTYEEPKAELCKSGFHACKVPLDVLEYYSPANSRYCEVDLDGVSDEQSDDSKVAGSKIKIGAEIGIPGLVKAHVEWVKSNITNEHNGGKAATAGDCGAATAGDCGAATAGYYGAATAGNRGAATAGDCGVATAGDRGVATAGNRGVATAGDRGVATAGNRGAATAGYYGAATSRGRSEVGRNGIACVRGNDIKVKGGIGAILVIGIENLDNHNIKEWKAVVVDGEAIKADTWYTLVGGEMVEIESE